MQCSFPAQVEDRLSSSSACSRMHPAQSNPEPGNWGQDSIPFGTGRADSASFPCLSMTGCCHHHLLLPTTVFQKKLTRQKLSIPGKPRHPPFGARDREAPHCSISSTSYSVLSNLGHSRLVHRHDYKHVGNFMVINN